MTKHIITAITLLAVPAMAAPALSLKPAAHESTVTIAGEYTNYVTGNDDTAYGITLKYDKILAPMNNDNYWSWNAAFNYSTGCSDNGKPNGDLDYKTMAVRLGIDANIVTNKNLTVFAGPRIGIQQLDPDGGDKENALMYGFSTGIRYITSGGTNWEVGYLRSYYKFKEEALGTADANSIYVGVSFGF